MSTQTEVQITLKRTLRLSDTSFYHQDVPKEEQFITAIVSDNDAGKTIRLVIFSDKLPNNLTAPSNK